MKNFLMKFYKSYFLDDKKINLNNKKTSNEIPNADEKNSSNNLIKNLKYNSKDVPMTYLLMEITLCLTYINTSLKHITPNFI